MYNLVPFHNVRSVFDDFDKLFSRDLCLNGAHADETRKWRPAVDIKEEEKRFVIKADVPGVDVKDIEITLENGVLSIKGERSEEKEEAGETYKRVERVSGAFVRSFTLPEDINEEAILASGSNGVLEISIPKAEKAKPRKIQIQ